MDKGRFELLAATKPPPDASRAQDLSWLRALHPDVRGGLIAQLYDVFMEARIPNEDDGSMPLHTRPKVPA